MSKTLAALFLLAGIAASAHATQPVATPNVNAPITNINAPVSTATGGTAVAGAAAAAKSDATAASAATVKSSVASSNSNVLGQAATGTGGEGGAAEGGGGGTGGANSLTIERSAPSVAVGAPAALLYDCRRTIGLGASSPGGSGVASGIPLWKEYDCTVMMAVSVATRDNGFTVQDRRELICKLDVVNESKTCKDLAESKRVQMVLNNEVR